MRRARDRESLKSGVDRRPRSLERRVHDRPQLDALVLDTELAGLESRHVDQVSDEVRDLRHLTVDDRHRLVESLGVGLTHAQLRRRVADGAERIAQLVRGPRQELRLLPQGAFGGFLQLLRA